MNSKKKLVPPVFAVKFLIFVEKSDELANTWRTKNKHEAERRMQDTEILYVNF